VLQHSVNREAPMHFLEMTVFGNTIQDYLISAAIVVLAIFFSLIANRILTDDLISAQVRS
jgi:hypothetical protein